jgi:pimeloyl-ACP methyl ester carboxylesterase
MKKAGLLIALLLPILMGLTYSQSMKSKHYTYILVHGMTGGGWDWKQMDSLLSAEGHIVYRPTLTGLGEKMHLLSPEIDLSTHIFDIVNLIKFEQLDNIILVGHSYGGMVITGVMNQIPERIQHSFFLDALVPDHDMSAMDVVDRFLSFETEDGIVYPPWLDNNRPIPGDVPHPLKTLTEKVAYNNQAAIELPATYVAFVPPELTREQRADDPSWRRAKQRGWAIKTLNSDHNAQRSNPEALKKLLISF